MRKYIVTLFLLFFWVIALSVPVKAEDNQLTIDFTDKAKNGQVVIFVGEEYKPSDYAIAHKEGKKVPLTETGLGENGELLGFTAEGDDVDTNSTGIYNVIYILRNSDGEQVTKKLTVRVEDKLEMDVANPIVLYTGENFDPALYGKAWRNGQSVPFGDLGPNGEFWGFIDNGDNVDTAKPGKYFITYTLHGTLKEHTLNKTVDVFVREPKLIIRYTDKDNNVLEPAKEIKGIIGETYYHDPININGYKYSHAVGENSGEFIAGEKTLTFVYTAESTGTTDTTTDTTDKEEPIAPTTETVDSTETSQSISSLGTAGSSSNTGIKAVNYAEPKSGNYNTQSKSYPKTGDSPGVNYFTVLGGIIALAFGVILTYKKVKHN